MTAYSLEDAPVNPVTSLNGHRATIADEVPDLSGIPEFSCETCGKELTYSGRGRKPKFCDDHKRSSSSSKSSGSSSNNEKLAAAALDVLVQGNNVGVMILSLAQMYGTASAVSQREEAFRATALEALKADPGMARSILKAGATSGKAMLMMAYGMLAVSVAPVAIQEFKEKRAAARDQEEEVQG